MKLGRLTIEVWKDTGTPRFRIGWWKGRIYPDGFSTRHKFWYFKMMSYYTLWMSWIGIEA